jgi:hypothetical protein
MDHGGGDEQPIQQDDVEKQTLEKLREARPPTPANEPASLTLSLCRPSMPRYFALKPRLPRQFANRPSSKTLPRSRPPVRTSRPPRYHHVPHPYDQQRHPENEILFRVSRISTPVTIHFQFCQIQNLRPRVTPCSHPSSHALGPRYLMSPSGSDHPPSQIRSR